MTRFVINNTVYQFNAAIGALIKVGSIKDLGSSELVTPTLPGGVSLKGRSQVSRSELFHIGKKDANFNEDDVERLHNIRNGFDSHEEFLNSPVKHPSQIYDDNDKTHQIYHSPDIKVTRNVHNGMLTYSNLNPNPNATDDSILVELNGDIVRDESNPKKHIKEMGNVIRAFQHFTTHPSGKRFYSIHPAGLTKEEEYSKARLYQKMGGFKFLHSNPSVDTDKSLHMFANHMSPDHLKEKHNLEYKKRIEGMSSETPEYRPTKEGQKMSDTYDIDDVVNYGFSRREARRASEILNGDSVDPQDTNDRKIIHRLRSHGFLKEDKNRKITNILRSPFKRS